MAISMNPASLAAVTNFLKTAGLAIDPSSSRGTQVSVAEADALKKAFDAIPDEGAKKLVGAALMKMIQADVFEVPSKTAQDTIAKVIGKPTEQVFSARAKAELVGGASIKSVATMALGLMAKVPTLDKAGVEKLTKALEALPKEVKNLAYAMFNNLSKDNEVKMAPDARPTFARGYAKAETESGGAVSKMAESLKEPAGGAMDYFASQMANSPYFEDRLAALMFLVCAKGMKEVDDAMRELDNQTKDDANKAALKNTKLGAPSGKTALSGELKTPEGQKPTGTPADQLKSSYEALIQAAAAHREDDGIITGSEARSLVVKLDRISPPEAKQLQAEAMGRALLATGGGQVTPEMKPLADWVEKTTGKPLAEVADATALYEAKTPLAQTIGGSDKLENKVAAYIVEGVFGEGNASKITDVLGKKMQPLFAAMQKEMTGIETKQAAPQTIENAMGERFGRIAEAVKQGKISVNDLKASSTKLVDRLPVADELKKPIIDGLTAGLNSIAQDKTLDPKAVFAKAMEPLVSDTMKQPETLAVIGNAVDTVRNLVADKAFGANDINKPLDKPELQKLLDTELKKAKEKLQAEGKAAGWTDEQLGALGAVFDGDAKALHEELNKTGKIEASEPRGQGTDHADPMETNNSRSRQVMFEKVKLQMNRLSEMMQAMSNILNTLHQTAENAIRAIR